MRLLHPAPNSKAAASLRPLTILLTTSILLAACSQTTQTAPSPDAGATLNVQVASYDLAVGTQRFMVGLITQEQELVGWGEAAMRFAYLGTREEQVESEVVAEATAGYLPIPNSAGEPEPQPREDPTVVPGSEGRGVYAAEFDFDRAGFWGVEVRADLDGEEVVGTASFEVYEEPRYPSVGSEAPRTENLTLASPDAPPTAIDSRADEDGVPDEELHTATIAESIAASTPTLVVISTPVYCVSRFCGPITDMVAELAGEYSDVANFIHIEVWRDFDNGVVNEAAAQWVLRDDNIFEPWVFLIDADGNIARRWDNVATRAEIEPALQAL